jgi:hypothetical protein
LPKRCHDEEERDAAPWLGRIWVGGLAQPFKDETSVAERLRVGLERPVLAVEGHGYALPQRQLTTSNGIDTESSWPL